MLLSRFSHLWLCATPQTAAHQASPSLGFSRQEHWSGLPFPYPGKWKGKWSHSVVSDSSRPHGLQPTRLLRPWDFPGKSTGVGCHCLLPGKSQVKVSLYTNLRMKVKVTQSCWTLCDPMDCSPLNPSVHGILQQEYWNGSHLLFQRMFPPQGLNLVYKQILYHLSHHGSPSLYLASRGKLPPHPHQNWSAASDFHFTL